MSFAAYLRARADYNNHLRRTQAISLSNYSFNFNFLTDSDCVFNFRFAKQDVGRVVAALGWPQTQTCTKRNRYSVSPILVACVILRRMASPCRWRDLEVQFGKHASQLCEIFWEGIEAFLLVRLFLLTSKLSATYIHQKASLFAASVAEKSGCLTNCIGFIDGTVLKIARPTDYGLQNVVYNGHKRAHALKFQALTTPDGMFLHSFGPLEGRRHDWTLYARSELESQLEECLLSDGIQYCIYGDSGYNWREYLEIPFQGAHLGGDARAFNTAIATSRVTVEWMFKEIKLFWTLMDFKRKLRIQQAPVASLYFAGMILSNIRNCLYRNETSLYFKCEPPSLEEFLAWRE